MFVSGIHFSRSGDSEPERAAKLLLQNKPYGLGDTSAYIPWDQDPPVLTVQTQQRHVMAYDGSEGDYQAQREKLVLADHMYNDGMDVLEALGAPASSITGGFARDADGKVQFVEGTYGKEGANTVRQYAICKLSAPIDQLDKQKIQAVLKADKYVKRAKRRLHSLSLPGRSGGGYTAPYKPFEVTLPLGSDYSQAAQWLEDYRSAAEKAIATTDLDVTVDDILPAYPQEEDGHYAVTVDFAGRYQEANILAQAIDAVAVEKGNQAQWEREEAIHTTGVDDSIAGLSEQLTKDGFPVVQVTRSPASTSIQVVFSEEQSVDAIKQFARYLHAKVGEQCEYPQLCVRTTHGNMWVVGDAREIDALTQGDRAITVDMQEAKTADFDTDSPLLSAEQLKALIDDGWPDTKEWRSSLGRRTGMGRDPDQQ